MRLTKFGHACVRIEHNGAVIVIDPGVFTSPSAVDGATAVLVTHEHADHWEASRLHRTDAAIHTIGAVAAQLPAELESVPSCMHLGTPCPSGYRSRWSARSMR